MHICNTLHHSIFDKKQKNKQKKNVFRQTRDLPTDTPYYRDARTHLKMRTHISVQLRSIKLLQKKETGIFTGTCMMVFTGTDANTAYVRGCMCLRLTQILANWKRLATRDSQLRVIYLQRENYARKFLRDIVCLKDFR